MNPRSRLWMWGVSALVLSASVAASAATFKIMPVNIGNGYVISGTIDTDGTTGLLTAVNFTKWNVVVTQTTDVIFTEKNTSAGNISGVSSDGKKIYVPTSPDGISDGGSLAFYGGGGRGSIPPGALVADFTGMNAAGGVAGWQTPLALNFALLNEPNGSRYTAAKATLSPNVFSITPVIISTVPLMKLFGTITTDGTIGALNPANLKSWNLIGREQDVQQYNEKNSQIINAVQVFSDNLTLTVMAGVGDLQIGVPMQSVRGRPLIVTLADYTDPTYPGGVASYYYGWQGLVAAKAPLPASRGARLIARVK